LREGQVEVLEDRPVFPQRVGELHMPQFQRPLPGSFHRRRPCMQTLFRYMWSGSECSSCGLRLSGRGSRLGDLSLCLWETGCLTSTSRGELPDRVAVLTCGHVCSQHAHGVRARGSEERGIVIVGKRTPQMQPAGLACIVPVGFRLRGQFALTGIFPPCTRGKSPCHRRIRLGAAEYTLYPAPPGVPVLRANLQKHCRLN